MLLGGVALRAGLCFRSSVFEPSTGEERLADVFWRAAFIECVLSGGHVSEPAEWAAECRERQQGAAAQLQDLAAGLPDEALIGYREAMTRNRLGPAFAALVAAAQHGDMPAPYWLALAAVAETLCLNELIADDQFAADDMEEIQAARAVHQRTNPTD
jgi:hypothetical protein